MTVAEAVAVERRVQLYESDPPGDVEALKRLGEWLRQFSPIIGLEEGPAPQSMLLDLSGCRLLYENEASLVDRVADGLESQRWVVRVAVADTIGAAWALAHHGAARSVAPPGEAEPALRPLPVEALRLPHETVDCLHALGIETIGALASLPRAGLPARMGTAVLDRLDQALGRAGEILVPLEPPPEIEATFPFEYATDRLDVLNHALDLLSERLHQTLHERHEGARHLECRLFHEMAEPTLIEVGLARPSRSTSHLRLLLQNRLERIALPGPVSDITLRVTVVEPLDDDQPPLLEDERAPDLLELSALVDQLSSQFGREVVTSPKLIADAQPEYACCFEPALGVPGAAEPPPRLVGLFHGSPPRRPLRMYREPIPIAAVSVVPEGTPGRFRWQGVDFTVGHSWGPERIETGWWRGHDVRRDYYVVETTEGARFWIFRRRDDDRWFLHGCFD
jgi:protein ImuB